MIKVQAFIANIRLKQGFPQLAVFSFDYIGARINAFGRYERDELEALVLFLRSKGLLKGGCVDVGANIGNHSVFFSDYFDEVHAFEPSARPYALLSFNSGLKDNIRCYNLGLSDHEQVATLTAPQFNIGRGTVDLAIDDTDIKVYATVRLVTLDSIEALRGIDIGLMKIDVEGHELAVLGGASEFIKRHKPAIVFEQQPGEFVDGSSPTIDCLREFGYRNFWFLSRSPRTRLKVADMVLRAIFGETVNFEHASAFKPQYYSMIVAIE